MGRPRPPTLFVRGPIGREDLDGLCRRAEAALLAGEATVLLCDVSGLEAVDAVVVDALARLQLTACRHGRRIRVTGARPDLRALLELAGLAGVVPCGPAVGAQPRRQPEHREQPLRVEEEAEPDDLSP
jgi:ABC-type transporter Mla MlaB component